MNKYPVRIMALFLVAVLALTGIPLGAQAACTVDGGHTPAPAPWWQSWQSEPVLMAADQNKEIQKPKANLPLEQVSAAMEQMMSSSNSGDDIAPLILAPKPKHKHKLTCWISDGTTHWRNCLTCKREFFCQNWCQDGDEDGYCNVCGGDVPYHDVIVVESEGGKIIVNQDTASHRTKITADVEPNEGYKLKTLHFVKLRDDGTQQEITRRKHKGQFWTYMPTYDLEVSAEFVKK